ncbi:uncharacterized protein LOC118184397 isoform X2 [Stegodyphus dumicola]|uniref:uncharacterized protein LOC118184397 isoform X2 n=1 Tax=Stegodyphus dumicola TaxID=202533 RepID=UPI0015A7FC24|nr:uncharacterized protein LOC118184397 isoform X2 [Stegodyphus dumicola]
MNSKTNYKEHENLMLLEKGNRLNSFWAHTAKTQEDFRKRDNHVKKPCHLREVAKFHLDSFNYMIKEALADACMIVASDSAAKKKKKKGKPGSIEIRKKSWINISMV